MAVALHQQGIYDLNDIQTFDYNHDFEDCFAYYKEHDKDTGTNNGKDIIITAGIKANIRWLICWCIYKDDTTINNPKGNDPEQWTFNKFRHFKTGCCNNTIIPEYFRIGFCNRTPVAVNIGP